jgi:hypothetical protein
MLHLFLKSVLATPHHDSVILKTVALVYWFVRLGC